MDTLRNGSSLIDDDDTNIQASWRDYIHRYSVSDKCDEILGDILENRPANHNQAYHTIERFFRKPTKHNKALYYLCQATPEHVSFVDHLALAYNALKDDKKGAQPKCINSLCVAYCEEMKLELCLSNIILQKVQLPDNGFLVSANYFMSCMMTLISFKVLVDNLKLFFTSISESDKLAFAPRLVQGLNEYEWPDAGDTSLSEIIKRRLMGLVNDDDMINLKQFLEVVITCLSDVK